MDTNSQKVVNMSTVKADKSQAENEDINAKYMKLVTMYNDNMKAAQARINQLSMANAFKRLDYLYDVVTHASCFSADFVEKCRVEFEASVMPKEEKQEETKDE